MAARSDDLNELLDSALEDFQSLNLMRSMQKDGTSVEGRGETGGNSFSATTNVQELGLALPDLGLKKKMSAQYKEEAGYKDSYVLETLNKHEQQTKEAFRALEESAGVATSSRAGGLGEDGDLNPQMLEEWVKQFEERAGPQGVDSHLENMIQRLLSKEILHEPLKEITKRYPKWLEDHREKLSKEDYGRCSQQYEVMRELIEVYERDSYNFKVIVELMQKMQECGPPPNDIIQELTPDIDLSRLGQISTTTGCSRTASATYVTRV